MPYSGIPAPRYTSPYDWSILAVGVNTAFALAESGRHDERVKPSYTHFFFTHILTRAIFPFGSARVSGRNKIFKDAYKICPSLFPPFFAVPPTFFSRLLWPARARGVFWKPPMSSPTHITKQLWTHGIQTFSRVSSTYRVLACKQQTY